LTFQIYLNEQSILRASLAVKHVLEHWHMDVRVADSQWLSPWLPADLTLAHLARG
jgi:hypothetical protein